jgi:trans-aconitate 2-methyltransferase
MADWNADLYNRFSKERMQPAIDLVNRIHKQAKINRILDVGCGTGMSTQPLFEKWGKAEIIGIDNSESMLKKAREWNKDIQWVIKDCNNSLENLGKFDLVFSNAALQWMDNQGAVIKNLINLLTQRGILAIQIPSFQHMKISDCIQKAVHKFGIERFGGFQQETCICHDMKFYYNQLKDGLEEIQLWQTNYYHIMNGHIEILEFIRSTGLKPYLDMLDEEDSKDFLEYVISEVKLQYGVQDDGKILFEFKRLFFMGVKA